MMKRLFDLSLAILGAAMLFPLLAIIALLIKIDSRGPVFYRGVRSGQHGRPFRIVKFRTMVENAEEIGGPSTALNDPRLTRIGKYLRKYKFDELPQILNIIRGEMSIVGPRPQVEKYTRLYGDREKVILSVRPGLTDYASIRFINLDSILGNGSVDEKYVRDIEPEKNRLRIKYVEEHTLWIDCKIIMLTVLRLFKISSGWNTEN